MPQASGIKVDKKVTTQLNYPRTMKVQLLIAATQVCNQDTEAGRC